MMYCQRPGIAELCASLSARSTALDDPRQNPVALWPREQLNWIADAGILRGFESLENGGTGWSDVEQLQSYLDLGAACLTSAFILTQYVGAIKRLFSGAWHKSHSTTAQALLAGQQFATVAISHLTTSRQYLTKPVLQAEPVGDGWILSGHAPWVTGAAFADWITTAAVQPNGQQVLFAVPGKAQGMMAAPSEELLGLTASCTGMLEYHDVFIEAEHLLAGPVDNVMATAVGSKTGGLTTSALAIGHATGPIRFLQQESQNRTELIQIAQEFAQTQAELIEQLLSLAQGHESCTTASLRAQANRLAINASQAALAAAKGTGYVAGHRTGRWCREALFFLVWSCPQPVAQANLCEFAGIAST